MLVRIGVVALAGALGLLGSTLITRKSLAAIGTSETTTTTTSASSTAGTTSVTSTAVSTATVQAPPTSPPVGVPVRNRLGRGCATLGGVMLLVPGRPPLVLKPVADPAHGVASSGGFVYPRGAAVVRTDGVAVRVGSCRGGARASGRARVRSPSLFEGAVTASAASLSLRQGRTQAVVERPRIGGKAVVLAAGTRVPVAGWGSATTGERRELDPLGELQTALAVHLVKPYAGLPAGTTVAVGFSLTPKLKPAAPRRTADARRQTRRTPHAQRQKRANPARRHGQPKRRQVLGRRERWRRLLARLHHAHRPLTLRPPLGLPHYVFPVAGPASFSDTYGAARSDVSWHHGDDIFAPLGTPVVAVADGTLNRVGWERLGGWRLWVRDRLANEFYYAHLSGYTQAALRGRRVKAGQVLGFIGDTGDAFGTPFHLHFEIHPRSLLPLRYDGAVDPTAYLEHWERLSHVRGSHPLHPSLPTGSARRQAVYVYRELLAAQGLIRRAPKPPQYRPHFSSSRDFGSTHAPRQPVQKQPRETQKASKVPASTFMLEGITVVFLATPAALAMTLFRRRGC